MAPSNWMASLAGYAVVFDALLADVRHRRVRTTHRDIALYKEYGVAILFAQ